MTREPGDAEMLRLSGRRSALTAARRRRRARAGELLLGAIVAVALVLVGPALAIVALVALVALLACVISLAVERLRGRRLGSRPAGERRRY
ncbi:MAG: hypothetical protein ACR2ND_11875 [Solirubrobacteraceae bacterium]